MNDVEEALDRPVTGRTAEPRPQLTAALGLARRGVHDVLASITAGRLQLQDPLGSLQFGAAQTAASSPAAPDVALHIHDLSAYLDIATGGTIGAAEAYMAGKWTVSDLPGVMRLLVINREVMNRLESGMARLGGALLKVADLGVSAELARVFTDTQVGGWVGGRAGGRVGRAGWVGGLGGWVGGWVGGKALGANDAPDACLHALA